MLEQCIFWICAFALFYIYLGYPILIRILAVLFGRPVARAPFSGPCSVVIAAYNESANLPGKIRSLLSSSIGNQLQEIIVASDGSTDATAENILRLGDPRLRVVEFKERRGKPAVLNDVIPTCLNEIVVLTDARQELHPDALSNLLSDFADDAVGVVSGELVFRPDAIETTAAHGIDAYWTYEKFIRRNESRFHSVPGATGALYAIRKSLFNPIPVNTLVDDVAIPMQAVVQGHRCVFEENAHVYDEPSATLAEETIRKRRTIAGNFQLISLYPSWLFPWRNPIWLSFMSHKVARLLSPWFLVGLAASNLVLMHQGVYARLLAAQLAFYLAGLAGVLLHRAGASFPLLGIPMTFISLNWTIFLASWDGFLGRYDIRWSRSAKELQK